LAVTTPFKEMTAISVVPPADIHNHIPHRIADRQACSNSCRHWLFDNVNFGARRRKSAASPTAFRSTSVTSSGTPITTRGRGRNDVVSRWSFSKKISQHPFRHSKVRNDAALKRTGHGHVGRRLSNHGFCVMTDRR